MTAAACMQVNEAVTGRDLQCVDVPDDICAKLADDIVGRGVPQAVAEHGSIVRVEVRPIDCAAIQRQDPAMVRCWQLRRRTVAADGSRGPRDGLEYYQTVDGRIFDADGRTVGN